MSALLLLLLPALLKAINPGILIGVPLPSNLPNQEIPLPYPLDNFTVQSAEFTNVEIKELEFAATKLMYKNKTIFIKECLKVEIEVSYMRVHFDFDFEGSRGPGDFQEAGLFIKVEFDVIDVASKPQIDIKRIEMDTGKIKVTLGGSVTDRVLSIITNFLISEGDPVIHSQIKKIIKKQVDSFNKRFEPDFSLLDVKVNSSMVAPVLLEPDFVSLNLNGAAFIDGSKSDVLNPSEMLKVNKSSKVPQLLVHEAVFNSAISVHFKHTPLNLSISTMSITSTIDVNSQSLTPVFPAMLFLPNVRNVIINLQQNKTVVTLDAGLINFNMQIKAGIETEDLISKARYPYMNPATATLVGSSFLVFGQDKTAFNLKKISIDNLTVEDVDIRNGNADPEALKRYIPVLAQWISSAFNGNLNTKARSIKVYGVGLPIAGSIKPKYVDIQLSL